MDLYVHVHSQSMLDWISGKCEISVVDDGIHEFVENGGHRTIEEGANYSIGVNGFGLEKPHKYKPFGGGSF